MKRNYLFLATILASVILINACKRSPKTIGSLNNVKATVQTKDSATLAIEKINDAAHLLQVCRLTQPLQFTF